jgi:hypothetical protein
MFRHRSIFLFGGAILAALASFYSDADAIGLNVARSWASGIRGGMSLGSPANIRP